MEEISVLKTVKQIEIKDLVSYVKAWLDNEYENEIIVGCDSIQQRDKTVYITTVVLYNKGKGGNILYMKDSVPRINDKQRYDRLFKEVLKAGAMADYVKKTIEEANRFLPIVVHLDINSKEGTGSNNVYAAGVGMITGMGYEVHGKPHSWAASHVADMIAKEKPQRTRAHGARNKKNKLEKPLKTKNKK